MIETTRASVCTALAARVALGASQSLVLMHWCKQLARSLLSHLRKLVCVRSVKFACYKFARKVVVSVCISELRARRPQNKYIPSFRLIYPITKIGIQCQRKEIQLVLIKFSVTLSKRTSKICVQFLRENN